MDRDDAVAAWQDRLDPSRLGAILLESAVVACAMVCDGWIVFANPAFCLLFEPSGRLIGRPIQCVVAAPEEQRLAEVVAAASAGPARFVGVGRRGTAAFELELCLQPVGLDTAEASTIVFAKDIGQRSDCQEKLTYLAFTDSLTGLDNRARFTDRLYEAMRIARSAGGALTVLMVDLDGFKAVNDTYGHGVGDVVLQMVGQRFLTCVRQGDVLARIGGDEFAALLRGLPDRTAGASVAARLIASLREPIHLPQRSISLGASIGIAVWPEHAASGDALLRAADMAMYCAKRSGKNRVHWADKACDPSDAVIVPMFWSAAHNVGVREMDEQHAHMAELIGRLTEAIKDASGPSAGLADCEALISFTAAHFASEERLMAAYDVDDSQHREEHGRLLHDIENLRTDSDLSSLSMLLRYLQEWLLRHIDTMDSQLAQALIEKGCR